MNLALSDECSSVDVDVLENDTSYTDIYKVNL